jgi:peptidoglycan/LPS O-acetylase OafA/YrhL
VTAAVSNFLGTASYAVYVLHVPLFDWAHVLWPGMAAPGIAPFAGVALISIVVILSWYLTVKVDQPLQKRLKQRMPGRKPLTQ